MAFSEKLRKTMLSIKFIQLKFRSRKVYRLTKHALLDALWFKVLDELREKALNGGGRECDKKMLDICEAIVDIPFEIRRYVLAKYQI